MSQQPSTNVVKTNDELINGYYKPTNYCIIDYLTQRQRILDKKDYEHSYPFCWRTDSPLIYRAVPSWFLRIDVELTPEQHPILPLPEGCTATLLQVLPPVAASVASSIDLFTINCCT